MGSLARIIYLSTARQPVSTAELDEILVQARRNNAKSEITGLLLFKDGNFLQVLEGDEERLNALIAKIRDDGRHRNMIFVSRETVLARHFPDWSMGFRNLDASREKMPEGFDDMLNRDWHTLDLSKFPHKGARLSERVCAVERKEDDIWAPDFAFPLPANEVQSEVSPS